MSTQNRLTYLLGQAMQRSATDTELQELITLIREDNNGSITREVEAMLLKQLPDTATAGYDMNYWDDIASRILTADKPESEDDNSTEETGLSPAVIRLNPWRWISAAAAVMVLSFGFYWFLRPAARKPTTIASSQVSNDVTPGGNKAMLVLADGTEIPLDSTANKALTQQGNTSIIQPAGGQLLYTQQTGGPENVDLVQYNTLRTPRGGQFQVTLPDGTKAWLNAASSLKYPVAFKGTSRQVELTGEAYFEVAHNKAMPFKVMVRTGQYDSMEVAVLGTQFNIMAYADETLVKTTLLEGAVKVSSSGVSKQLAPGQGAYLDRQHHTLALQQQVDTEEAVAWKNGLIQLDGNDITSIMRMIARWYDVDVIYTAPVPAHFRGIIPRNVPVSQVLKMMEMTGEVHFEIKGKQIIVSP
ncbi:FecR family protein [Chitinophaga sp.]|uniref:FecR family protein n=1 Tax=Chitinophaga sp. TaxID=1869181 RepID=UPI002F95A602